MLNVPDSSEPETERRAPIPIIIAPAEPSVIVLANTNGV
jgi:hypothetical protein